MRRFSALSAIASLLVLGLFVGNASIANAVDDREFIDHGRHARTDGRTVVWAAHDRNIYAARPEAGETLELVDDQRWRNRPDVSGDIIVWLEGEQTGGPPAGDNPQVWGLEWGSDEPFLIHEFTFTNSWIAGPAISGNYVVWIDRQHGVMMRNISTMEEARTLTEIGDRDAAPSIRADGSTFLWLERWDDATNWRLRTLDVAEGSGPRTIRESSERGITGFDISGDFVVYGDPRRQLVLVDVDTGEERVLGSDAVAPVIEDRYVFWSRLLSTPDERRADLIGYDLQTDSRFTIVPGGTNTPASAADGVLAWLRGDPFDQDDRIFADPIIELLPTARHPAPDEEIPQRIYFSQTGHNLVFGFKAFWEESGGLPVFGFPLTEEFDELNRDTDRMHAVQYFERQRFEYHSEHAGSPYEVQLGRLGVSDAEQRGLLGTEAFRPLSEESDMVDGCQFVQQTGHTLCGEFRDYWQSHGLDFGDRGISFRESLALFGYPISEEFVDPDTGLVTQYFERARFEYHPDNPEPHQVLLGRLGAEVLAERDW